MARTTKDSGTKPAGLKDVLRVAAFPLTVIVLILLGTVIGHLPEFLSRLIS